VDGLGQVEDKEEAIIEALKSKGKFILGSNELDEERLPSEMILTAYKSQASSVERALPQRPHVLCIQSVSGEARAYHGVVDGYVSFLAGVCVG